ncbi:anthranilate phosphoribosyltransferase [Thalassotalea ponticola]|uniref:anthranilate phosphoribosyltransferase n=1 Tax=Thalassotalea ponticola TaxID=1523392 RepID=UPI0025B4F15A|nr:anthranilate phosphoribosyltransferase [Thalassotalea ponticola]MDN3653198.1 anthranilate phosphoribosyltransferase [Thalassotalea ponticola]
MLSQLINGDSLSQQQSEQFFSDVISGQVEPALLSAVLTALAIKGETPEEIAGAALAIRAAAKPFVANQRKLVDCVGTGGDGHNTINISTTAAIVAGACGLPVAKHGNRSVSSKSGSADLLETLGVKLDMSAATAYQCIEQAGTCFLYAPHYHAGFKHAAKVRSALGVRTLFNILGPLVNPAAPKIMLLGVYDSRLLMPMAKALQLTGVERAWVVYGSGLDEIAIHGPTQVIDITPQSLRELTITPEDFAIPYHPLASIKGGSATENAQFSLNVINGCGQLAHHHAVVINTAALLYLAGQTDNLAQASDIVQQAIAQGLAANTLATLVEVSHG